jgi:hypothetical protein
MALTTTFGYLLLRAYETLKMEVRASRTGMLRPTWCKIVPRDRTTFEPITTIYHYTPQLQIAAAVR